MYDNGLITSLHVRNTEFPYLKKKNVHTNIADNDRMQASFTSREERCSVGGYVIMCREKHDQEQLKETCAFWT